MAQPASTSPYAIHRDLTIGDATRLLHAGAPALRDGSGPVNVPVVRTSTVRFESVKAHEDHHHRRAAGEPVAT